MTIRREDLKAASAVGLLHYRQIEPLLVFLLQRDVRAKREELLAQQRPAPFRRINKWLAGLVVALALLTAALFAMLFAAQDVPSNDGVLLAFFAPLYGLGALALAPWIRWRSLGPHVRVLTALTVASVPLAVVALHHVPA